MMNRREIGYWQAEAQRLLAEAKPLSNAERQRLHRGWQLSELASLARQDHDYSMLHALVVGQGLLAQQAEFFGGFRQCTRDLEGEVLPAAAQSDDWPSFLLFALRAANLRGLAMSLADEDLLSALVGHGKGSLVDDVIEQMTDPLLRARSRAIVAGSAPLADRSQVARELELAPAPEDAISVRYWTEALVVIARNVGPALAGGWTRWLEPLTEASREQVWAAALDTLIAAEPWDPKAFHRALAGAGSRAREVLTAGLAESPRVCRDGALETLRQLADPTLYWHAWIVLQGRRLASHEVTECALLERLGGLVPWSVSLLEAGRELWPRLDRQAVEELVLRPSMAEGRQLLAASLAVCRLEGARGRDMAGGQEALARIGQLSDSSQRLHWALRCLDAQPSDLDPKPILDHLESYLRAIRFEVADADLVRYLDLWARQSGVDLGRRVDQVLRASGATERTLYVLAAQAQERALLWQLFETIEICAAAVARNEASGFALRREILTRLAARLCRLDGDLQAYDRAVERLLPSEEEELRTRVALAAAGVRSPEQAERLLRELRTRGLKLQTELLVRQKSDSLEPYLRPARLYAALANCDRVEDEMAALALLLESPTDPVQVANQSWSQFHDPHRRLLACLDLAFHAVIFQEEAYEPGIRDHVSAMTALERALEEVGPGKPRLEILPELVALRLRIDPSQALTDFRVACQELLSFDELPWSERQLVLERLLDRLVDSCHAEVTPKHRLHRCQATCAALTWLCALPVDPSTKGGREARQKWPWILSAILATAERLPEQAGEFLAYPLGSRWSLELHRLLGIDLGRVNAFFERLLTNRRLEPTLATPWKCSGEVLLDTWDWLTDTDRQQIELCLLPRRKRIERLHSWLECGVPAVWQALLPLVMDDPGLLAAVLGQLPSRDRRGTSLRCARGGGLREESWGVLARLADRETAAELTVLKGLQITSPVAEESWLEALSLLVQRGRLKAGDPHGIAVRHRLWQIDRRGATRLLAAAVAPALAVGGRKAAEEGLCLWLGAYVGVRMGRGHATGRERLDRLRWTLGPAKEIAAAAPSAQARAANLG